MEKQYSDLIRKRRSVRTFDDLDRRDHGQTCL